MIKLKHASFLLILVLLQACVSSKSTSGTTAETSKEMESDTLKVNRSKTAEEAGIKTNSEVKTKSIVVPEKKKK